MKLRTHGDPIEKEGIDFIEQNLPYYEKIWESFIGNNNDSEIHPIEGEEQEEKNKRTLFAQNHYTVYESIYLMKRIIKHLSDSDFPHIVKSEDYLDMLNNLICFQANGGRIFDNIKQMYFYLNPGKSKIFENVFSKFWLERHIYLHGKKLPFSIKEGSFFTPELNSGGSDYKTKPWQSFSENEFVDIIKYLTKIFDEICSLVSDQLATIYNLVEEYMKMHKLEPLYKTIEYDDEVIQNRPPSGYSPDDTPISGSFD